MPRFVGQNLDPAQHKPFPFEHALQVTMTGSKTIIVVAFCLLLATMNYVQAARPGPAEAPYEARLFLSRGICFVLSGT